MCLINTGKKSRKSSLNKQTLILLASFKTSQHTFTSQTWPNSKRAAYERHRTQTSRTKHHRAMELKSVQKFGIVRYGNCHSRIKVRLTPLRSILFPWFSIERPDSQFSASVVACNFSLPSVTFLSRGTARPPSSGVLTRKFRTTTNGFLLLTFSVASTSTSDVPSFSGPRLTRISISGH